MSYSFKPTIQWVFILSACCSISFSALFLSSKAHLIHFSIGLLIFLRIKGFSVTKASIDSAQSIEDCCIQCKYFTDQWFSDFLWSSYTRGNASISRHTFRLFKCTQKSLSCGCSNEPRDLLIGLIPSPCSPHASIWVCEYQVKSACGIGWIPSPAETIRWVNFLLVNLVTVNQSL